MPLKLKKLQGKLGDSKFYFIDSGKRSMTGGVYLAVKEQWYL